MTAPLAESDLELTPFEKYMILDDRPRYPMTFVFQLTFEGPCDPQALATACNLAIQRHPLLTAALKRDGRRLVWTPREDQSVPIQWIEWDTPFPLPPEGEGIDLTQTIGLRVWAEHGDNQLRCTLQFHHACCDGIGALRFMGDWLAAYHAHHSGNAPPWPKLQPEALAIRGRSRWKTPPVPVSLRTIVLNQVRELVKWFSRHPRPLALADPPLSGNTTLFPGILSKTLSVQSTRKLRSEADALGLTLNDLLIAGILRELAAWNQEFQPRTRPKDWLQITIPTSLRDKADERSPAANILGYAFVARRLGDCLGEDHKLEHGIQQEMELVRRWNLGMYFQEGLRIVDSIPGMLRAITRSRGCFATTVFTNLGDATRRLGGRLPRAGGRVVAGEMHLIKVVGIPPLRPKTRGVFSAIICDDRLTLSIRGDAHCLSLERSGQLLARVVSRLTGQSVDGSPATLAAADATPSAIRQE